jgi:hypothetical protein
MNDELQIRHYSAAPFAKHSRVRPASLRPPPIRLPNPTISNRERRRLEINVTPTKQTLALHSNREKEACFQIPTNPPSPSLQNVIASARKPPRNSKNTTRLPSFLFRLKPTPTVYFVEVTGSFNRTMFRLRRISIEPIFRSNGPSLPARKRSQNVTHRLRISNRESIRVKIHPPRHSNRESNTYLSHRPNPRISNRENVAPFQSMNPAHPAAHLTGL